MSASLYGKKSRSFLQKLSITFIELLLIALSVWIMFGDGQTLISNLFGWPVYETPPARRWIILGFSLVVLARMAFTMFYLMKRTIPWPEVISVPAAFALYYVGFAILVLPANTPVGFWDWLAIAIYFFGSWLNTASEFQRNKFKALQKNKGKLYTQGLFAHSMHINFFGDILWVLAYAIATHNPWSALIVIFITLFFMFINVPMLDTYLADRYGQDFVDYAKRTKQLIPFIW